MKIDISDWTLNDLALFVNVNKYDYHIKRYGNIIYLIYQ